MSALGLSDFLSRISAGRDGVPISIDEAQEVSGLNRAAVLDRFRKLQSEGEGYLRLGRHGHPTRFYFRSPSGTSPGSAVRDVPSSLEATPSLSSILKAVPESTAVARDSDVGATSLVEHHYQLRGDLRLSFRLPSDLTEREAGRLARFIETLPL